MPGCFWGSACQFACSLCRQVSCLHCVDEGQSTLESLCGSDTPVTCIEATWLPVCCDNMRRQVVMRHWHSFLVYSRLELVCIAICWHLCVHVTLRKIWAHCLAQSASRTVHLLKLHRSDLSQANLMLHQGCNSCCLQHCNMLWAGGIVCHTLHEQHSQHLTKDLSIPYNIQQQTIRSLKLGPCIHDPRTQHTH